VDGAQELATLGLLFLAGLLSRLPFTGRVLYHWDSVNFALGLQQFDIARGQPHAPGYILYIWLGRLASPVFRDPQWTLAAISMAASALAVVCLYRLGCTLYDRRTGLLAAALLASSPLFWFYGEVALPHALDGLAVIVTAWLFYRILEGEVRLAIPAAICLGIAGGLRPQTQVFLAPLAIYVGLRLGWERALATLAALALVDLAWFLPLTSSSGGVGPYVQLLTSYGDRYNSETSVFEGGLRGLARNTLKLGMYSLYGVGLALPPLLFGGMGWLRDRFGGSSTRLEPVQVRVKLPFVQPGFWAQENRKLLFFLLWILPVLGYYALIHMGQQGLVFVFLPALLLLAAAGFFRLGWERSAAGRLAGAALIVGNVLIFLSAPTYPLGGESPKLLTYETLRQHDAYYLPRIRQIPQAFAPEHSILLSAHWRYPEYYLPQYVLLRYGIRSRWEIGAGRPVEKDEERIDPARLGLRPDAQGRYTLILLDDRLIPFNQTPERVEWIDLGNGQKLGVMRFTTREQVVLSPNSYGIAPESTASSLREG
jgi:hypothetical protein